MKKFLLVSFLNERLVTVLYFNSIEELKAIEPVMDGTWNKKYLYEYLVCSCNKNFREYIDTFFANYENDEKLVNLLFEFLLDDYYDGSDSQMGAAHYIGKINKDILRRKKDLLLKAQENEVAWKRPFPHDEDLTWL